MNMTYKEILPGIRLRVIESSRFETNYFSVQFLSRATASSASSMTLVPRVLRRGSLRHPDMEALAAALDDMFGARIEPVSRKYGDIITSGFICDFVDSDEKSLPSVMKLLGEIMFEVKTSDGAFLSDYVSGERSNLIDEIKSEINNKLSYAHRKATETMFSGSAYAISELGTEEAAEAIDEVSLFDFYKKMVSSLPCEIFFCGSYSFDEIEREVIRLFSLCRRGEVKKFSRGELSYKDNARVTERLEVAQANLLVGMYAETEEIYLYKLLAAVIGGGTTSKLFENVREKQSLCYFAGAMFDSFKKNLFMYCGIDPKNAEKAEKSLLAELQSCIDGNITDEELSNAKKGMIDDLLITEDSPGAMEAFWLRASIAEDDRTPLEVASEIKKFDSSSLARAAGELKVSVTYLLTGLEGDGNERKLLSNS